MVNLTFLPDPGDISLKTLVNLVEKVQIERALDATGGNRKEASKLIGLNRTTMIMKMKKLGIPLNTPNKDKHNG